MGGEGAVSNLTESTVSISKIPLGGVVVFKSVGTTLGGGGGGTGLGAAGGGVLDLPACGDMPLFPKRESKTFEMLEGGLGGVRPGPAGGFAIPRGAETGATGGGDGLGVAGG